MSLIAYFDCFSGISGDMVLGALVDAGGEVAVIESAVAALGLTDEVAITTRREHRGHLGGTRVIVEAGGEKRRTLPQLEEAVRGASIPEPVRVRAVRAISLLGAVESELHGVDPSQVHLHELGGADTLVDLVGSFWLLESMSIGAIYASPLPAPSGRAGELPLPAPASLRVLERTGAVLRPVDDSDELVTPTGAVILATAAKFSRPAMSLDRVGYGIGSRGWPGNGLAVWVGEAASGAATVTVIETNLDDLAPNLVAALVDDLFEAGALDVTVTPAVMKKGRPGHIVSAIAEPTRATDLARLMLLNSSTMGVRMTQAERVIAKRSIVEVKFELGIVRVKTKELEGEVVDVAPEFDDVRRLAQEHATDTARVMRLAAEAARRQLGV
jgi:uncharacterized protein (TIGR00299 family) protein